MTERKLTELLGSIDPALIAEAEESVPVRRKPIFKVALVAAVLAALLASLCVAVPFIPITPDLDYATSPESGAETAFKERNVWIWYTENGRQRREYVRLPGDASNVFMTWAHFCGLGEDAVLYDADFSVDEAQNKHATLILSTALRSHPDAEVLLHSLQKTFAKYYGIPDGNVAFSFSDASEFQPESNRLKFSHSLEHSAGVFMVGTVFEITATMTNISDEPLEFVGATTEFVPKAIIRMDSGDLEPLPMDHTADYTTHSLAPGESISVTYTFEAPLDAPFKRFDLILSFDKDREVFEQAILFNFLGSENHAGAREPFVAFLEQHTPKDFYAYRDLLKSYTYNGQSIMDGMTTMEADGALTWWERGDSEHFSYYLSGEHSAYDWVERYEATFTARQLPDGMVLPLEITTEDSIVTALTKIGFTERVARIYLDEIDGRILINLAYGEPWSSNLEDFTSQINLFKKDGYFIISCWSSFQDERVLNLYYNADDMQFAFIEIALAHIEENTISISEPVRFAQIMGKNVQAELTETQCTQLETLLNGGIWRNPDALDEYVESDVRYDCFGTIGAVFFAYSTEDGVLNFGGYELHISPLDYPAMNELLAELLT